MRGRGGLRSRGASRSADRGMVVVGLAGLDLPGRMWPACVRPGDLVKRPRVFRGTFPRRGARRVGAVVLLVAGGSGLLPRGPGAWPRVPRNAGRGDRRLGGQGVVR